MRKRAADLIWSSRRAIRILRALRSGRPTRRAQAAGPADGVDEIRTPRGAISVGGALHRVFRNDGGASDDGEQKKRWNDGPTPCRAFVTPTTSYVRRRAWEVWVVDWHHLLA